MKTEAPKKYRLVEHILFPPCSLNKNKLDKYLAGKTILISGASFGIGNRLACLLATKEVRLILVARTEAKLKILQKEVENKGGKAMYFCVDFKEENEIDRFVNQLQTQSISIDILINNAGKSIKRALFDSLDRYHDFTRTMAINYFAPVKLCLAFIPTLEKNKGHIINVSAANVLLPAMPHWAAYQASKTAFDEWLKSATPELRAKNIAVSTLYLPLVKTRMIAPTKAYENTPAMHPEHAAKKIAKLLLTKKREMKPWWLFGIGFWRFLFEKPFLFFINRYYKNHV